MKVMVIGGGPAGMISAISASNCKNEVTILEKMNSLGRKLLITGKGRCNITSSLEITEFIKNIPGNGKFLYSVFNKYTNKDIIELLRQEGVEVKQERGNRIFPITDHSQSVLQALQNRLKKQKVTVKTEARVTKIITKNNMVQGVEYQTKGNTYIMNADKIIIATGGKSYPLTGSTGDGYELVKQLGHTITLLKPSLVPFEIYEKDLCKQLQGLSLRNVEIEFYQKENKKVIYQDFGEMVFTHFGISGPTILSGSAHILRVKNIENLMKERKIILKIDLKPGLTEEKLDERIRRDFQQEKNKYFKNSLDKLLPKKIIDVVIQRSKINYDKPVNEITKPERKNLVKVIKNFEITIQQCRPIEEAIITAGGVNVKEINSSTMESKIIKGLYFAGEIIDVDGYTGGFNLQIAYSTGYTAGLN